MGYGKHIYDLASAELEARRLRAEEAAYANQQRFYAKCPQAEELKYRMAAEAARAAKIVLGGGNVREELTALKERNLRTQQQYRELLRANGLSEKAVLPQYTCSNCKDTGFVDGKMCSCLKELQRKLAYEQLSRSTPLHSCTFENFSLEYYRGNELAYRQMERTLTACRGYAERFHPHSKSILFRGGTGLGKTHLSLAIANKVLEKGYGVVYGSTQNFAVSLEKERFDRIDPEDAGDTNSQLISCDLLILDDLGTEFSSSYVTAALYNVINTRLQSDRPTIISTNLSFKELETRYSERLASRIIGDYAMFEFIGKDVRAQKRWEKMERAKESQNS